MLTKALGICILVVAGLLALSVAGFLFSLIWKIGVVALVACGLYYGWQLVKG